jgi:nitroreductase
MGGSRYVAARVTTLDLLTGLATTRAIRRIRPDPIPDDDLATILWHATRAPSGSNRQPTRFLVLRDGMSARTAKALLGEAFRAGWDTKARAERYGAGSGVDPGSRKARQAAAMARFVERFEEIPVVVLATLVPHRTPDLTLGASVYPACQNLLLAARALGYGGVLTMWHAPAEPALREVLAIPPEVIVAATIPLGRPEGRHGPVRRRPLGEMVFEDSWHAVAPWASDPPGTRFAGGPPAGPEGATAR